MTEELGKAAIIAMRARAIAAIVAFIDSKVAELDTLLPQGEKSDAQKLYEQDGAIDPTAIAAILKAPSYPLLHHGIFISVHCLSCFSN